LEYFHPPYTIHFLICYPLSFLYCYNSLLLNYSCPPPYYSNIQTKHNKNKQQPLQITRVITSNWSKKTNAQRKPYYLQQINNTSVLLICAHCTTCSPMQMNSNYARVAIRKFKHMKHSLLTVKWDSKFGEQNAITLLNKGKPHITCMEHWLQPMKIYLKCRKMLWVPWMGFHCGLVSGYQFCRVVGCARALWNDWLGSNLSKLFDLFLHFYIALYFNKEPVYTFSSNNLCFHLMTACNQNTQQEKNYNFLLHASEIDIVIYRYISYDYQSSGSTYCLHLQNRSEAHFSAQ
jgi:hypothetical protein